MLNLHRKQPAQRRFVLNAACVFAATALLPLAAHAQNVLPTGKKITLPALGTQTNVGSLPMNLILSPDGKYAISTDMGFRESLSVVSTSTGAKVSSVVFGSPLATNNTPNLGLYYGLAIVANGDGSGTLYAAEGNNDAIAVLTLGSNGSLTQTGTIATKKSDFPSGLALDSRGYLYVANNDPSTFASPCSLAIYNTKTQAEVGRYTFPGTPNFPLAVAALSSGSKVYVSSQRDSAVYVINTANPAVPTLSSVLPTGAHPISLLLNRAQTKLFVANAHSDTVSVVNTATDGILDTILLRPTGAQDIPGATPTGLALSPDEGTLYATLGDMNAVAVVALGPDALTGYIPAGWYPTAVAAGPKKTLLVANAKGVTPRNPNPVYHQWLFNDDPPAPGFPYGGYDLNIIEGTVATLAVPNSVQLKLDTQQVLANNKITAATSQPANPLANVGLKAGGIKHVIYIVKENRTYDQVLGDLPQGNGNPTLALFGQKVTPNLHAIASRFVLLDNFYDCGEASGDGWPWSTQSMATEYVIKNLPYNYSNRGRNYDFEGQINGYPAGGFPANDPYGVQLSPTFPMGTPAMVDVSEAPNHHIWDDVEKAGLTYRNYGFFYDFGVSGVIPDNYPAAAGLQPGGHDLGGMSDVDYRRYDNDFPDSDAGAGLYALKTFGHYNEQSRFAEWNREFQEMLTKDPTGGAVPAFMTVRFHHDHTQGPSAGKHTPRSEVADNDYAVGQLVQAISASPIWDNTAIFVIEDDAQDGPDHVDCHRSTCYVISPWIKANSVDHTFYNTDSVLKTMELLLGVPPMSQYDAVANPILDFDTTPSNGATYTAVAEDPTIIAEMTPTMAQLQKTHSPLLALAKAAAGLDFIHPDSAPDGLLNELLWQSVMGVGAKMPAPRHTLDTAALKRGKMAGAAKKAVRDTDD